MKKPPPQLPAELAAVVAELLGRALQPLNVAKLRSQLKVPAKLKDAFGELLAREVEAGRVRAWPGEKYWDRDCRAWAVPVMVAAARVPVAASRVAGAVSKQCGKRAAESLLAELLEEGALIRVPLFGGAKAKVCSQVADEAALRRELDEARRVIESGYRRLGNANSPLAVSEPAAQLTELAKDDQELDNCILTTLAELEPRKGLLVTAPRLYRQLDAPKSDIDTALIRLQDAHRVILHRHSNPQSQDAADLIAGLYVGACWRLDH